MTAKLRQRLESLERRATQIGRDPKTMTDAELLAILGLGPDATDAQLAERICADPSLLAAVGLGPDTTIDALLAFMGANPEPAAPAPQPTEDH